MLTFSSETLCQFSQNLLQAKGMSAEDARVVAQSLAWADDRAISSHGVAFLPRYLELIEQGDLDVHARPEWVGRSPGPLIIDAHQSAGAVAMAHAMKVALAQAQTQAVVNLWVSRYTHAGAMGQYVQLAAEQGYMAMLFNAGPPLMAYHGAATFGATTGPLAMAVPGPDGEAVVFDMATSEISFSRLKRARALGTVLPMNVALDAQGGVTTNSAMALTPLPLAGPKGSGLALMFELMASAVLGNPLIAPHTTPGGTQRHSQNAMIMLARVSAFPQGGSYLQHVKTLKNALKALPKAQGVEEIFLPGERRARHLHQTQSRGVQIDEGVWKSLTSWADKLNVVSPVIPQ